MSRKGSVEIAVSEKRQLVVNLPQTRLHTVWQHHLEQFEAC